jgi:CheY-like chemotaxis protein
MPEGGRLHVELESRKVSRDDALTMKGVAGDQQLLSGQYVVLAVEDTGCGIDPEIVPRIFEPYFTTRKKQKGTGMGLAVVYGIVKSHHGVIHVYTDLGKGTAMRVYLPTSQTAEHYYRAEVKTELKGGSESILVVDDEAPLAQMIGKTLTRLGYRVTVKSVSTEALELIRRSPGDFDLVVSDQTMPGLTGDKLAEEIRKIRPDIPIILCSGFSEVLTPEREKEIHVSKLVRKPFIGDELELEIRKLLDEQKPK